EAVTRATELRSLGLLNANRELYLSLVDARPRDLEQLGRLPIPVSSGAPVPLASLGTIALAESPEVTRHAARDGEAVLINILRQPAASTVTLSKGVHEWLQSGAGALPPDVKLDVFYDQADLVRSSIASVRDALLLGGLMAIVIIALFIGSPALGSLAAIVL